MNQKRLGFLTTLYITAMGLSTAVASSVAVPITQATSWQGLVWVLTVVCAVALVIWLPNARHNHYLKKALLLMKIRLAGIRMAKFGPSCFSVVSSLSYSIPR